MATTLLAERKRLRELPMTATKATAGPPTG
jgi:hypothetical protein